MNLVSENIRFMRIFAGVPLGGGVKRHCGLSTTAIFIDLGGYVFKNVRDTASVSYIIFSRAGFRHVEALRSIRIGAPYFEILKLKGRQQDIQDHPVKYITVNFCITLHHELGYIDRPGTVLCETWPLRSL